MTYDEIIKDVEIANKTLIDLNLDVVVSNHKLLCEVYCLTPFHWQSFYLKIYDGDEYVLQYAKPYFKDFRGLESVSLTFQSVSEAENHPACRGKIFCGIKKLDKDNSVINMLLGCLPEENEIDERQGIFIDGIITLLVNHKLESPVALYYRDADKIILNSYTEEKKVFLDNLYEHIEEIIGNLRVHDKNYLCLREMHVES